jgi:hypothetical protein
MGLFITDNHKSDIQGVRNILFVNADQLADVTILSDQYLKLAELDLVAALSHCDGFSRQDICKLREQIDRTTLDENDPNYVSTENYMNEFGTSYEDDSEKLCLLILALQYKIASKIVIRQPQIISARVLGAQFRYSEQQNEQRGLVFDDEYDKIINALCPRTGVSSALGTVRVADPWVGY